MKKTVVFLLVLVSTLSFAQQKQFKLDWDGYVTISTGRFSVQVPSFNAEYFDYSIEKGVRFVSKWQLSSSIDESSAQLENVTYTAISKSDLKGLDVSTIPNNIEFTLRKSVARFKTYGYLEVSPIIKDGENSYKKITSFNLVYNTQTSSRSSLSVSAVPSISSSVLKSGEWYQFFVDTTGVYKLSKSFLRQLGVSVNSVNPKQFKIYGNGGSMIPYDNADVKYFDIVENAIQVVGEADGSFDDDDYILFYAIGPNGYNEQSNTNINCYTTQTSYFLKVDGVEGKRIQAFTSSNASPNLIVNTHQTYVFHEVDEYNLAQVGRRWFGDRFDVDLQQSFSFEIPDLVTSESVRLKTYVASTSDSASSFDVSVNGTSMGTLNLNGVSDPTLASGASLNTLITSSSDNIVVSLNYNQQSNPSALGYLDYISLEATRALKFNGEQFGFYNLDVALNSGYVEYQLENASGVSQIWNVSDPFSITSLANSTAESTFSFVRPAGQLETFVAVTASDYYTPTRESNTRIENQDLKGTVFLNDAGEFQDVDYIIVAPTEYYTQAVRLAAINKAQYGLNVKVATLDAIYNEFSTGNQDIAAIRNFIKYVYDNASSPNNAIKYLCMFGDSSYDYKGRLSSNAYYVPSWHEYNSFSLTSSYVSDDFYGMMDDNEGGMETSDQLDIALGRILADNPSQAKEMVDKIERYYQEASYGSWRNSVIMVSDDIDDSWEYILEETTNQIADEISEKKPFINVTKIHSDAYSQESSSGGDRYPEVNEAMISAMQNGALLVNYFGHGGEDGLATERIFMATDAEDLSNKYKMNCFVTVTCEFTRFDNPLRETAGEITYWNPEGGAVSLLTTTREIFVSVGISFNTILTEYLFSYNTEDGYADDEYPSMAEALRLTKTNSSISYSSQKHLVFYIGDPAMKLAIPKPNIKLTAVNGKAVSGTIDQLKALDKVTFSGEVTDTSGNLLSDYNGILTSIVYDKDISRSTLGNDGTVVGDEIYIMDFATLGEIIFRGQASVVEGKFSFDFVVPKDIGVPVGSGRVSFYAKAEEELNDQSGSSVDVIQVGGINENAEEDNIGPVISLYMNDENFVTGGITNESPSLLVKLEDENGINTASGIGHDLVAVLDGDETTPYVLNDYYQTEVDDYTKGVITYPFRDLEAGLHTLTVKAWDVYNNSSTSEIQFVVYDESEGLIITNVLNYPNPFVNYTEFWFNHNSSGTLDVSIQIFTVSGKLVRTINGQTNSTDCCNGGNSTLSRDIVWDGRDDFGDRIGKGVYVYKLKVRSQTLNKTVEKIEKLVIL
ncbi:type IX secretion system sortase PorU [Formosa sediminum]|uniref:Type IX secretion system sortase PorU n=1 Tax=Formosa sediminum TaxID=2594004 RepID=A0A516GMG0_9FLAO|nr:type IX secretion system sortase PorU [Formosa sediminum]QDO92693.1 type IX secretion system sortase PorU [Formosa sediminum]